ncbi:mersacidin/lichenicidin family type 2 lantibiotic [Candidatus Leptofilum sp.]|uniref:mersacidin/lichenicidin family type 2 lantibiotic n=1 Tax=Candidatus Leptofilum sp. TaxID=3241576 RepID=UPI003B5CE478
MSQIDVIRAWKDEAYRHSLTKNELMNLPPNPAGILELNDVDLKSVAGATVNPSQCGWTAVCVSFVGCNSIGCGGGGGGSAKCNVM